LLHDILIEIQNPNQENSGFDLAKIKENQQDDPLNKVDIQFYLKQIPKICFDLKSDSIFEML
jgi:hypothetical protein